MRTKTRPTMLDPLIGPWSRAVGRLARLSPITKKSPGGHGAAAERAVGRAAVMLRRLLARSFAVQSVTVPVGR